MGFSDWLASRSSAVIVPNRKTALAITRLQWLGFSPHCRRRHASQNPTIDWFRWIDTQHLGEALPCPA